MQLFKKKEHLITRIEEEIPGAIRGDARCQKALYDALSGKMFAVCLRYMGDRDSAQDVLQDGFVTFFSKLSTFTGDGSLEGWARKIFVNTALMALRRHDILKQSEDVQSAWDIETDAPSAIQNISYDEIMKVVSELPPGFRTVFNMYAIEGYSHKEIARELGISEATSRSQFLRARAVLQQRLQKK